jgi:hypothetical protein
MTESVEPTAAGAKDGPDVTAVYPLGSSAGESARLQRQAEELAPDSAALLDRVGLRPGQSAIDLGCGPRGILDLLAGRVSRAAGSWASTPTRRTPPWRPGSSATGSSAAWRS